MPPILPPAQPPRRRFLSLAGGSALGALGLSAVAKRIELGARQGVLPRPAVSRYCCSSRRRARRHRMASLVAWSGGALRCA